MKILYHFRTRGIGAEAVHIAGIATAFERLGHQVDFSNPMEVDPREVVRGGGSDGSQRGGAAEGQRSSAALHPHGLQKPLCPASWKNSLYDAVANHCPGFIFELCELAYNLPAWFRNARLLRREGYALIYERHAFFLFSTALLAQWRGIPLVVEVNELVGDERVRAQPVLAPLVRACDRMVFRRASLIVVVAPHIKRRLAAMGVERHKLLVSYNAVDDEAFAEPAQGELVRQRHGIGNSVLLGFVGGLSAWHRLDLLVEVFARLRQQDLDVRLMIVGEGVEGEALVELARRQGVLDRSVFVGKVAHAEIPSHLAAMDIGVVPHSNEYRSPIKLFEYMGQGRAVVAPRTEPIADVVQDGVNGLLFEPGSVDDLCRALARLVENPRLRGQLGVQARQDVLRKYTWKQNARAVLERLPAGVMAAS